MMKYSRAFQGAYDKGRKAALAGKPRSDNPYRDLRAPSGAITFARGFRNVWAAGWKAGGIENE